MSFLTTKTTAVSPRLKFSLLTLICAVFLLSLPTSLGSLSRDDFYHRNFLLGLPLLPSNDEVVAPSIGHATDKLFSFFNEAKNSNLSVAKSTGWIPWWTSQDLKVDFWRPLTALTHWLDYQLWPELPEVMHLQNIAWYLVLVAAIFVLFGQLNMRAGAIILATSLYALDASHAEAIGWIANRNIIISASLGVLSLIFLLEYLQSSQRHLALAVAAILSFLTLLSAEGGLSIFPFLILAIWLVASPLTVKHKVCVSLIFLSIFFIWQLAYKAGDHGATGSGAYLDPAHTPLAFIRNGLIQWPILFMDQMTGIETLAILLADETLKLQATIAYFFLAAFLLLISPLLKKSSLAVFLLLSALGALIPAGTTILTGGRLMFISGIAICGLIALFAIDLFRNADWVPANRAYRGIAKSAVVLLALTQLAGNAFIWGNTALSKLERPSEIQLTKYTDFTHIQYNEDSILVLVNPPLAFDFMYVPAKLSLLGKPSPQSVAMLLPGTRTLAISRSDTHSLTISCPQEGCPISPSASVGTRQQPASMANAMQRLDTFFYDGARPLESNLATRTMEIAIDKRTANKQLPTEVTFKFSEPLDAAKYVWVIWNNQEGRLTQWNPPAPGNVITVAGLTP